MTGERLLRAAILSAADTSLVRGAVSRYGMRCGAQRFVAGTSVDQFYPVARRLNADGFAVAAGILGEAIGDADDAGDAVGAYCALLRSFSVDGFDANVAFKLTHVGLDLDPQVAFRNAERIVAAAAGTGNTARIDMEHSAVVDATLAIYRRLRQRFDGVGCVLQSYLRRSRSDLEALLPTAPNLRLVKGAYLEPPEIAFASKSEVDDSYVALAELALSHGGYTAIATHDPAIVARIVEIAARRKVPQRGRFEFQLLYGIGTPLARRLLHDGYRVRIAVPFGSDWFPYFMRRLAERPANLAFFLKGALSRG